MKEEYVNEATSEIVEIDLSQFYYQLKKHIRFIIISIVTFAVLAFVYTNFFVEKKYASQARIYITPKVSEEGLVDYSSLTTGNLMVNNYISILKGENLLNKVAENIDANPSLVRNSLSVGNDANTQIITIRSMTGNPELSKSIVDQTVQVFQNDMAELLKVQNLVVLDSAKVNPSPISPSVKKNTIMGGAIGLILSGGYVFLKVILDKRLHNKKEVENYLNIPVLAEIPWIEEA